LPKNQIKEKWKIIFIIENDGNLSWIIDKSIIGNKMPEEFKKRNVFCCEIFDRLTNSIICFVSDSKTDRNKEGKKRKSPSNNIGIEKNEDGFKENVNGVHNDKLE